MDRWKERRLRKGKVMKLKPKLQKVCNFYLKGASMREALLKAGYSDSYASHNSQKFLHNRSVQRYIRERQKAEADAELADAIYIKKKLMDLSDSPDADVALAALKQLDAHNKWINELEAKFKEIETKSDNQQNIIIKLEEA